MGQAGAADRQALDIATGRLRCRAGVAGTHGTAARPGVGALVDFTRTIELKPKNAGAYYLSAKVYRRDAQTRDQALADMDQAIVLNRKVALFFVERGAVSTWRQTVR